MNSLSIKKILLWFPALEVQMHKLSGAIAWEGWQPVLLNKEKLNLNKTNKKVIWNVTNIIFKQPQHLCWRCKSYENPLTHDSWTVLILNHEYNTLCILRNLTPLILICLLCWTVWNQICFNCCWTFWNQWSGGHITGISVFLLVYINSNLKAKLANKFLQISH